jgi:hypothetical protein
MKTLFLLVVATPFVVAALWAQAPKKDWKDLAEYELYISAVKQTDNAKKLELLNTWQAKYPDSDYKAERLALFFDTYQALNQPEKTLETGGQMLASNPKDVRTLYIVVATVQRLAKPTPELLAIAEKAARTLTTSLDELKPAEMSAADWNKGKPEIEALGHLTLGWIAMARKENEPAEKEFLRSLQSNPNQAQVSYWLGNVVLAQKNVDKQSLVLFHYARAASYTGAGALTEQGRKEIATYLTQAYTKYHGSAEGLEELRKTASAQALPPEGFKILSGLEIDAQKEEEFKKSNPMLALWMTVKGELTGANGPAYFESSVKGALLPGGAGGVTKFKGKLISMAPAKAPKQLILGITDANNPEVTLNLDEALAGAAPVGTELEFEGVASSFTAQPFKVVFDVEKAHLTGWPAPAVPGAKKGVVPGKKGPATKK